MAERSSVNGILTSDRAEKSSVPEELAADMAERSSVHGILTADRAEKSSVPEELAADMAERSSVHGILTADRAEKSSVPEELAADMAERSSVHGILTADRAEKSSVPEDLAADMAERSSVHGILTADRAEKSSVPEELAADMAERSSVHGILTADRAEKSSMTTPLKRKLEEIRRSTAKRLMKSVAADKITDKAYEAIMLEKGGSHGSKVYLLRVDQTGGMLFVVFPKTFDFGILPLEQKQKLIEKTREFRRNAYVAFVDFKAAFDSVDRNSVWLILRSTGLPDKYCKLFEKLYEETESYVQVNGKRSTTFNIKTGVRQGCAAAPELFNFAERLPVLQLPNLHDLEYTSNAENANKLISFVDLLLKIERLQATASNRPTTKLTLASDDLATVAQMRV
ncbi:hypothetical protein QYM36_002817 [Artemia franciscana]|uniref:Reverse transcriptase domain-containing protein n=1 Tax=Artemia franciscana TaxID=6661 RepID=A0AA88I6U1_ARTSF|nr:hypothetical protein QYM36_002817 [Artemia franciscana]